MIKRQIEKGKRETERKIEKVRRETKRQRHND
jgi:hypothetical protein